MARAIPIIRLHGTLLVSIQIALSDQLILALEDDLAHEIRTSDAHGLVIEVSGVDIFDSFIAGSIQSLSKMARLMGVRTVLAGLNAGMAITLVEMGMYLEGVETALSLETALRRLGKKPQLSLGVGPLPGAAPDDEALLFQAAADDEARFFEEAKPSCARSA